MRLIRPAFTFSAAAALATVLAAPAAAIPNPTGLDDGLFTIHLAVPDPASLTSVCLIDFTPTSSVTFLSSGLLVGTANETGKVTAKASGCGSVSWTNTVTVVDEAPGHATRVKTGASFGNPTTAIASQSVGYAVSTREAGLVTVTMAASSRLIDLCWQDIWGVSAAGNPSPVKSGPC